jgi:hypothetical protein
MEIHPSLLMDHHRIQAEDQRDVDRGPYITFLQGIQSRMMEDGVISELSRLPGHRTPLRVRLYIRGESVGGSEQQQQSETSPRELLSTLRLMRRAHLRRFPKNYRPSLQVLPHLLGERPLKKSKSRPSVLSKYLVHSLI